MTKQEIGIVGAGLAGCEAAYQLLKRGISVRLYEMRPQVLTPAHSGGEFAELVCSNSLRAAGVENAVGLLKEEMRRCDSLIIAAADATAVPAGGALAVDRHRFSAFIEAKLREFPHLTVVEGEVSELPPGELIIAAGPLASPALSETLQRLTGESELYFHDAIAPIVDAATVNMDKAFFASRYGKGNGDDYLNCPFTEQEYKDFYRELISAEVHPLHDFEAEKHFSGCMPIESMARYGEDTIRFGPLKPVGLEVPQRGGEAAHEAYAVVQLRKEDAEGTMYNIVGFQTRLNYGEQKRVFRMIPGLEKAEFYRLGSMHRNTYINSPLLLDDWLRLKSEPRLRFAGQITGVEGYVESAACGLMAGVFSAFDAVGAERPVFPRETALGSMLAFTRMSKDNYQPMNINFGLFPPLNERVKSKKDRFAAQSRRALQMIDVFIPQLELPRAEGFSQ